MITKSRLLKRRWISWIRLNYTSSVIRIALKSAQDNLNMPITLGMIWDEGSTQEFEEILQDIVAE